MYSHYVNTVYSTYMGEVNFRGIGAPVIFLRLQGCHLRCYLKTLGVLCDTPEGLEARSGKYVSTETIQGVLLNISSRTGIEHVCLSGGDPLWRKPEELRELLLAITKDGFSVSVETSGTLSIEPYSDIKNVYWVLDYKVKSAGIKQPFIINEINLLKSGDFIKFVLLNGEDYAEFKEAVTHLIGKTDATIAVGPYWGGELTIAELVELLKQDGLLGQVTLNVQLHKMATFCDAHQNELTTVEIPKEL